MSSEIYYVIEDEDGNSWDRSSKREALDFARQLEEEGHVCVHVFQCIDDDKGEQESSKMIY